MKLLRSSFRGVAGLPDITIDLSDAQSGGARDLFVVTGPPGSGKTRILEAIIAAKEVIAPYGMLSSGAGWVAEGAEEATVDLEITLDADEQRIVGTDRASAKMRAVFTRNEGCRSEADDDVAELLGHYDHTAAGKIEYLPANRALPPPGPAHGLSAVEQRFLRLGRDVDKYSFVPRLLVEAANDTSDDGLRSRFESALAALMPEVSFVADRTEPLRALSWRRGAPVLPSEVGSSVAHAVLVAANAALVRWERSIVLLDRPERGVDERSMGGFVRALRTLAAGGQVIVATSSPALKNGVEGRSIHTLATGT